MVNNIQGAGNPAQTQQSQAVNSSQVTQQVQLVLNNDNSQVTKQENKSSGQGTGGVANVDDIRNAVQELNSRLETQQIQVNFDVDDDTGRIVVKVKDIDSGEVIRQIPSEATLEFAHNAQKGVGVTLDGTF